MMKVLLKCRKMTVKMIVTDALREDIESDNQEDEQDSEEGNQDFQVYIITWLVINGYYYVGHVFNRSEY